jgi:hypothetical protein
MRQINSPHPLAKPGARSKNPNPPSSASGRKHRERLSKPGYGLSRYTIQTRVRRTETADGSSSAVVVAVVDEFPMLRAEGATPDEAIRKLRAMMHTTIAALQAAGSHVPLPPKTLPHLEKAHAARRARK